MADSTKPSALERTAGSLATESVLTVFAAVVGGPLAPLLPVLAQSLAARRQQARVEAALTEIRALLAQQEIQVANLNDEQYKLVNEAVLAVLQTTHTEKLVLLRNAIQNALTLKVGKSREAALLSRIIRDISVEEASFLFKAFAYQGVKLCKSESSEGSNDKILCVSPQSDDALNFSGLVALGILTPVGTTYTGINIMAFTDIAAKVIALLRPPNT